MRALLGMSIMLIILGAGRADAYPQCQLSQDPTCTGCHVSPSGGGLLNENGLAFVESQSWQGTDPAFFYGVKLPSWLQLGGDLRGAAGAVDNGTMGTAAYPMQAEVYAAAGARGFTLNLTGGFRRPQDGGSASHVVWSREHYLMWQQHPGTTDGLYVRAGRLMPVFGLRLAEHIVYTQRYGGYPLYGEAYAAAIAYITQRFEVHATGFIHDSIASAVEHGNGGAFYSELRFDSHAQVGAEAKYASDDDTHRTYLGMTGKLYLESLDLLLQAEGQLVHQKLVSTSRTYDQLIGYLLASRPLAHAWLLDVGVGHFTEDTDVQGNYRDCVDANLHWFVTSHLEALVTTRLERLGSGPMGGYALAQIHYRL